MKGREGENVAEMCLYQQHLQAFSRMFVHFWLPPRLSPGCYLFSILCPVVFLHLSLLSALSQRWSLWPSSCPPVLAPILQSSTSSPQTSVRVTGERTVTFPRHPTPPILPLPLLLFAHSHSHIVRSTSWHSSSTSTFVCHPLSLFLPPISLRLTPLTVALFFFPRTLYPIFTSVKLPLLPLPLSSVPFLSLPLQFMAAISNLLHHSFYFFSPCS